MSSLHRNPLILFLFTVAGVLPLGAQQLYFDVNGETAGFGIVTDGVYTWNTTNSFWSTSSAGNVPTGSWVDDGTIRATFQSATYTVELDFDPQLRILEGLGAGSGTGFTLTFQSTSSDQREITLFDDQMVRVGSRQTVLFGDGVTIANNSFTIESGGSAGVYGVGFVGDGPDYEGTITVQNLGSFNLTGERTNQNTHLVVNGNGRFGRGSGMIGSLSGDGGFIVGVGSFEAEIMINQSTDTVWGGSSSEDRHSIIKQGTGRLTINGNIENRQRLEVQEGALYLNGAVRRVNTAGSIAGSDRLDLFNEAELGGNATFELGSIGGRVVTVLAPTDPTGPTGHNAGTVAPGNPGEAGTLTLGAGFRAQSGANLLFRMNGLDESENLHNSHLLVEEIWDVGGDMILYFEDLGQGEIMAGTPYRIISAPGISTSQNWLLVENSLPANWTVGDTPFTVVDDELYITFSQIPEPAAALGFGLTLLLFGIYRMRRRRS